MTPVERPDPHPLVKLLAIVIGAGLAWLLAGMALVLLWTVPQEVAAAVVTVAAVAALCAWVDREPAS